MIYDFVIVLPHYYYAAGGILASLQLAEEMHKEGLKVHVRFENKSSHLGYLQEWFKLPWSVGRYSIDFPACRVALTYSDTPYLKQLKALPQVGRVAVHMLSYGMAIARERPNALDKDVLVLSTTNRTKEMIEKDGGKAYWVGHGHDWDNFYREPGVVRKPLAALLYHYAPDKRYDQGVRVVNRLMSEGLVEGSLSFGHPQVYDKHFHPEGMEFRGMARRSEIREIFSRAAVYLMPSVTEGLNLTPAEATLCGCPAVLCDGAFGSLYVHNETCFVATKDDDNQLFELAKELLCNENYARDFKVNLTYKIKKFTWPNTVVHILNALKETEKK